MISNKIVYEQEAKSIVDAFNFLPAENQEGSYWEAEEVTSIRRAVKSHYLAEQAYKCCYCGRPQMTGNNRVWDIDHIVARSTHARHLFEPTNLAVCCVDCNIAKSDQNVLSRNPRKYPTTTSAFLIVHPHFDVYEDHIDVVRGLIYAARSRKGEKTIIMCRLLRYAYEFIDYPNMSDDEDLMEQIDECLGETDPAVRRVKLQQLLRRQERVSATTDGLPTESQFVYALRYLKSNQAGKKHSHLLGLFSTVDKAKEAILRIQDEPEFANDSGDFVIDKNLLDHEVD